MRIALGADHGGFELKELVKSVVETSGHIVEDVGCFDTSSVDYPIYADQVCDKVGSGQCEAGILICGTGIGMSMAANRNRNIRAALCHEQFTAEMSREHNDANVLCIGARVVGAGLVEKIVATWLNTDFAGGRHQTRIGKFSD